MDKNKSGLYAQVISIEDFVKIRPALGTVVCTSGGFDPIHPGHTSSIIESKKFGKTLVVLVDGDDFLIRKKGKPFMDIGTRCDIIASLREVNYVIPLTSPITKVSDALRMIRPNVFTKGGDRCTPDRILERDVCDELNISVKLGVGAKKKWSSSVFLESWCNSGKPKSSGTKNIEKHSEAALLRLHESTCQEITRYRDLEWKYPSILLTLLFGFATALGNDNISGVVKSSVEIQFLFTAFILVISILNFVFIIFIHNNYLKMRELQKVIEEDMKIKHLLVKAKIIPGHQSNEQKKQKIDFATIFNLPAWEVAGGVIVTILIFFLIWGNAQNFVSALKNLFL